MWSIVISIIAWSHDWDLNPGPLPYHGSARVFNAATSVMFVTIIRFMLLVE